MFKPIRLKLNCFIREDNVTALQLKEFFVTDLEQRLISFFKKPFEQPIFHFDQLGKIRYRWFDDEQMIERIKVAIASDAQLAAQYHQFAKQMKLIGSTVFWIKSQHDENVKSYRLGEMITSYFNDPSLLSFNQHYVSFIGEQGPFNLLNKQSLISPDNLEKMVLYQLLTDKLPKRHFRLQVQGRFLTKLDLSNVNEVLNLVAISEAGIHVKISKQNLKLFDQGDVISFYFDTSLMVNNINTDFELDDLCHQLNNYPFDLFYTEDTYFVQKIRCRDIVIHHSHYDELYSNFFIPLDKLFGANIDLKKVMVDFINVFKMSLYR